MSSSTALRDFTEGDSYIDWTLVSRNADIVLAAKRVGPSAPKIRLLTGIPIHVIANAGFVLRQAGIWFGNNTRNMGVAYDWWDKYEAGEEAGEDGLWQTAARAAGVALFNRPRFACGTWDAVSRHQRRSEVCGICEAFTESERTPWSYAAITGAKERQRRLEAGEQWKRRLANRREAHAAFIRLHKQHQEELRLERAPLRERRRALRESASMVWSLDYEFEDGTRFSDIARPVDEQDHIGDFLGGEMADYELYLRICATYRRLPPIPNGPLGQIVRTRRRNMKPANHRKSGHEDKMFEPLWTYNRGLVKPDDSDPVTIEMIAERESIRRDQLYRDGVLARRGRPPQSINHGTEGGARTHYRRGERPCESCRKAHNRATFDRKHGVWTVKD